MKVLRLYVKNYRNLMDEIISFDSKINVFYGENAQGKTNILEALWMLSGARSFRGTKDLSLVAFGQDNAQILGDVEFSDRINQIEIKFSQGKRLACVNEVDRGNATSIIGLFKAVVFSPEHLCLIKGGPDNRRRLIDAAICQLKPTFPALLVRYNKTLRQRNVLLKNIRKSPSLEKTLDVWDSAAASYSSEIVCQRIKYINMLSSRAKSFYYELSQGETLDVSYLNWQNFSHTDKTKVFDAILKKLRQNTKTDITRGFTSAGAHRDELDIKINNKSARIFASQGQQRSAVIALKLAEAEIISNITGETPVILLDDILSELDLNRQKYMLTSLTASQTIITGCVQPRFKNSYKSFLVKNGKIVHG